MNPTEKILQEFRGLWEQLGLYTLIEAEIRRLCDSSPEASSDIAKQIDDKNIGSVKTVMYCAITKVCDERLFPHPKYHELMNDIRKL